MDIEMAELNQKVIGRQFEGVVSSRFSSQDMVAFGNFIRDNYYGVGAPKLISYFPSKYPHGTIEDIFVIWCFENGY